MCCLLQRDSSHDHSKPGTPPLSPKKAEPLPAQLSLAQADTQEGVQDSQTSMHGEQGVQGDSQAKVVESHAPPLPLPGDESEQLDLLANGPRNSTLQQQDVTNSAYVHSIDRQSQSSDDSLPSASEPQATNDNNPQPNSSHLDSFGSLIETKPDSNGNADTLSTQNASIQETTTPGLAGLDPTATAANDQAGNAHSASNAAESMAEAQPEQQAEQQLPTPSLYMSSQVDPSSRNSLAESVQSVPASQQQPVSLESVFASQPQSESLDLVPASQHRSASPSSSDEADELGQAAPKQVTGTAPGGGGSPAHQEASGSQQSSLDDHEQHADLPGTPASTAYLRGSSVCWQRTMQQQQGCRWLLCMVSPACWS